MDMYNSLECSSNKMKCHYENLTKVKHGIIQLLHLTLISQLTQLFPTAYFMTKQNSYFQVFGFKGLSHFTVLYAPTSQAIRLTAVTQEKCTLPHLYLCLKCLSQQYSQTQLLGYKKLFYHSGFSFTVTTSFKILLERNNHSFLWVPTAYCSNLYSALSVCLLLIISFLCVCHHPSFPDYKLLHERDRVLFIFVPITISIMQQAFILMN